MEEELAQTLQDIGLSKNEAAIYLALNELGSATVTKIADKSKVHRTNIYDSLNRLIEKGLVSYFVKDNVKFFSTTDPNHLTSLIREKENMASKIIPTLKLREKLSQTKEEATILKGAKAFMNVLYDFLEYNEPIYVFGIPKVAPEMIKTMIMHFHKERERRKIMMKSIYNYDARERMKITRNIPYHEPRYIDDESISLVSTNICGDEVVLALWIDPVFIVKIKNRAIADAYRHYWEILWRAAVPG